MRGEVGGDEIKLFAVVCADQIGITHAFFAERADKNGLGVVEFVPLPAIVADHKVNLLGHRRLLAFEGDEEKAAVAGQGGAPGQQGDQKKQFFHGGGRATMGGYRWNCRRANPIVCQLIFFSGKAWFASKSMKAIQGYHLIKPEDLFWRPSNLMNIPNADYLERTGSENLGARLWRLPPKSANTLHKHIRAEEFYFVLEGTGRMRVGDETLTVPRYGGVLVGPDQLRQVFNDTDAEVLWLIIGAPEELEFLQGSKSTDGPLAHLSG